MVFGAAFALMTLNFADRHVVVAAFPQREVEWGASDAQLGALVSVVSVTVALGALPAALLVDRWSRVRAIALMASVWSVAAAAAGLAQSYGQLVIARAAVGAGEAGYGPAAGALLATIFPAGRRATVLGAFQAAASLGAMLGVALGGVIAVRWGGERRSWSSRCPVWPWLCCSSASGTIRRCGWTDVPALARRGALCASCSGPGPG